MGIKMQLIMHLDQLQLGRRYIRTRDTTQTPVVEQSHFGPTARLQCNIHAPHDSEEEVEGAMSLHIRDEKIARMLMEAYMRHALSVIKIDGDYTSARKVDSDAKVRFKLTLEQIEEEES